MKYTFTISILLFFAISAIAQIEKPKVTSTTISKPKSTTAATSAPSSGIATVEVTWNGADAAKIVIGSNEFFLTEGGKNIVKLNAGQSYSPSVILSDAQVHSCDSPIIVEKGKGYLTLSLNASGLLFANYTSEKQRKDAIILDSLNNVSAARKRLAVNMMLDSMVNRDKYLLKKNKVKTKIAWDYDKGGNKYKSSEVSYDENGNYRDRQTWNEKKEKIGSDKYSYDENRRLIKDERTDIVNNTTSTINYLYDENGKLVKMQAENYFSTYEYNSIGLKQKAIDHYSSSEHYTLFYYNESFNLIREEEYSLADNHLENKTFYTYDNFGNKNQFSVTWMADKYSTERTVIYYSNFDSNQLMISMSYNDVKHDFSYEYY